MAINILEFVDLEKRLQKTEASYRDVLAPDLGKVYVIAITRDGCPSCEKQKPLFESLAARMKKKHGDKVVFTRVHIQHSQNYTTESTRSKDVFHHYFYPTNLILIRTLDRGAFEYYRNTAPEMSELEKNLESAIETAVMLEKES